MACVPSLYLVPSFYIIKFLTYWKEASKRGIRDGETQDNTKSNANIAENLAK